MKYFTRLVLYKASNVQFDPISVQALSYDWWRFVDKVNGKVIFNNSFYSSTTCRHQSKVHSVLRTLGIEVDLVLRHTTTGLQNIGSALDDEIRNINYCIEELRDIIAKPRTRKATNERRKIEIVDLQEQLYKVEAFKKSLTAHKLSEFYK